MKVHKLIVAAALAACIGAPAIALAAITVSSGTQVHAMMTQSIGSGDASVGQHFTLDVTNPYPNHDPAFAGAKLTAHVVKVQKAGQGVKPELAFVVDKVALHNGASSHISAKLISVDQRQKDNTGRVALTALGGMVAGNIIGKWLGTNIGGAIGLSAGVLYGLNSKTDVTVPSGSEVVLQLEHPVTLRR